MSAISAVPIAQNEYTVALRSQRCLLTPGKSYRVMSATVHPLVKTKHLKLEFEDVGDFDLNVNVPVALLDGGQLDSAVFRNRVVNETVRSQRRVVRVSLDEPPGGYRALTYYDGKVWGVACDFKLQAPREGLPPPSLRISTVTVGGQQDGGIDFALGVRGTDDNLLTTDLYGGGAALASSRLWTSEEIVPSSIGYKAYRANIGEGGVLNKNVYLQGLTFEGETPSLHVSDEYESNQACSMVPKGITHTQLIISLSRARLSSLKEVATPSVGAYKFDLGRDAWVLYDEALNEPISVEEEAGNYGESPWIPGDFPISVYFDPTGTQRRRGADEPALEALTELETMVTSLTVGNK
jgi:hypothetical protein